MTQIGCVYILAEAVAISKNRVRLDAHAHFEKFIDGAQRYGADDNPTLGLDHYKPFLLKPAQGVPHGRSAGVEALAEYVFVHLAAGQIFALNNRMLDGIVNLLFQTGNVQYNHPNPSEFIFLVYKANGQDTGIL